MSDDVKARHPDIPQDALPLELTDVGTRPEKLPSPKSVRQAKCKGCCRDRDQKVGVVRLSNGVEVFREHNKQLIGSSSIRCSGSGEVAP